MQLATKVPPGGTVTLAAYDPVCTAGMRQDAGRAQLAALSKELGALQAMLYAASQHAVLIVLQGMDTSGKDGAIKRVMAEVNPQGCRVESFKAPTAEERAHDFLWRVHRVVPPRGILTIFNRSHYEDVIVVRVHELEPNTTWQRRYEHINAFEQLLVDNGTIVLKFFLHISRAEQKKRLEARERAPEKAWKLSADDWREREQWDEYIAAYEAALSHCSTAQAPWYIVPADKKWFRDLAIAEAIVRALRPYCAEWEQALVQRAVQKKAELRAYRVSKKGP
jgi:PPK2 family polyphosphate:nucleotide phosphotransferase